MVTICCARNNLLRRKHFWLLFYLRSFSWGWPKLQTLVAGRWMGFQSTVSTYYGCLSQSRYTSPFAILEPNTESIKSMQNACHAMPTATYPSRSRCGEQMFRRATAGNNVESPQTLLEIFSTLCCSSTTCIKFIQAQESLTCWSPNLSKQL